MLHEHVERACRRDGGVASRCARRGAGQAGLMEVDSELPVVGFEEKHESPKGRARDSGQALGSMGVYVFTAPFLYEELEKDA